MLLVSTDSRKYIAEFKDRFSNFAQKAPILVSFTTSEADVRVKHENSGTTYKFDWDYSVPVKSFIHEIKQTLSDLHYPRIARVEESEVPISGERRAALLEAGVTEFPQTQHVESTEIFRIDKVIVLQDFFIIQSERDFRTYRYKLNYSSIYFLKDYRTGRYKSIEEAGKFFFEKATLLNEMTQREV